MSQRVMFAILLATILFGIYSWYTTRYGAETFFVPASIDINQQYYETATEDIVKRQPTEVVSSERQVSPSGPASPAMAPPRSLASHISPPEEPYDPQEQSYESAQIPERLRHPERSFGPAVVSDETEHAVASGIASNAAQITSNAYQMFGPEMAQNGGSFLENGVMANDSQLESSYSSV
jgi:hypothetical protein